MNIISVSRRKEITGYSTPEEAINAAVNHSLKDRLKSDTAKLEGTKITDGYWTDNDFIIKFSNNLWIHVYSENDIVKWTISETKPILEKDRIEGIGAAPMRLSWGNIEELSYMDKSKLLGDRIGNEFHELFCNDVSFYIYTKKQLILTFSALCRTDTNEDFLYVFEDD
ncbi:MAG: hypothetical protein JW915_00650 [Chitinispirillaceae bacterium]|nr:hypothetical protein [Chitinispirillaceae bacterium]